MSALVGSLWNAKDGSRTIKVHCQQDKDLLVINQDTGHKRWITLSGLTRKFDRVLV